MCGIIGYVGSRPAKSLLLGGLERLEYRGYDSAGLALLEDDGLDYVRAVGNLDQLKAAAGSNGSDSTTGVGHTRWATHGRVSEENAHPLTGCAPDEVAVVLNGIVENFVELKARLLADGHTFTLRDRCRGRRAPRRDPLLGRPGGGRAAGVRELEGHFAFVVIHRGASRPARRSAPPVPARRRGVGRRDVHRLVDRRVPARDAARPAHRGRRDRHHHAGGRALPQPRRASASARSSSSTGTTSRPSGTATRASC